MSMKYTSRTTPGFTFIEVLVVSVIIILLATIAMVSYTSAAKSTRDTRRKQDVDNIRVALESYRQSYGEYPESLGQLVPDYLSQVSVDPLADSGWEGYEYQKVNDFEYQITVYLENGDDPQINGGGNAYVQEEPK